MPEIMHIHQFSSPSLDEATYAASVCLDTVLDWYVAMKYTHEQIEDLVAEKLDAISDEG